MADNEKGRKQRVYSITITKDIEPAFELLKANDIQIAKVCRDAIRLKAEMLQEREIEEEITNLTSRIDYLKKVAEQKREEEKLREEVGEAINERLGTAITVIERSYNNFGWLSKPFVHRVCTTHKIEFDELWFKLPVEWTANSKGVTYEEATGTKEHKS